MKPQIFLGSSAENLNTLNIIAGHLSAIGDCVVWPKAFAPNRSSLDSLITQSRLADFSILLAMKDDVLTKRGVSLNVSRDNVIFEFGLFLGSAGINKAFLMTEENIDLPSDLNGITLEPFSLDVSKYNSIDKVCQKIIGYIQKASKSSGLGLLPSTALAIGYYNGFIKRVCEDLHHTNKMASTDGELTVEKFRFTVIIPKDLDDNGVDNFKVLYNKKHGLTDATTLGKSGIKRGYPLAFKIEADEDGNDKTHDLVDIPSTLNTIVECMKIYLPHIEIGQSEELEFLEKKELANFAKVLKFLISKNVSTKNNVFVEENVTLD